MKVGQKVIGKKGTTWEGVKAEITGIFTSSGSNVFYIDIRTEDKEVYAHVRADQFEEVK